MQFESEILNSFRKCIPSGTSTVVIHSSLAHLYPVSGLDKWGFLRAVRSLVDEGITLAFPAFTLSFCKGKPHHYLNSNSETGILSDWVLELTGAARTKHPIYSFVVIGPLQDKLAKSKNSTTFGDDSIFAEFESLDARVIMAGCGWEYCTQFHRYEEKAGVPYRFYKMFSGAANFGDGEINVTTKMYARDLVLDCMNDFSEVTNKLRARGKILSSTLWRGQIESVSCMDLAVLSNELLSRDRWAFVAAPRRMEYLYKNRRKSSESPRLKIALLGHSNLHILQEQLLKEVAHYVSDQEVDIFVSPYGQLIQQIVSPDSELAQYNANFTFFVDRIEDLLGVAHIDEVEVGMALEKVGIYTSAIKQYRQNTSGWIFVNAFGRNGYTSFGAADESSERGAGAVVQRLRTQFEASLKGFDQLHLFDLLRETNSFEGGPIVDPRLWFLGRFPFSKEFSNHLARRYTGLILSVTGRTIRLLLLDLDNTLWGGILGEDGISGIRIGGDYPGNTYAAFQKTLLRLAERGIALAICSKNDESHALEAMNSLPEMIIKPKDIVTHRINWNPKYQNAADICKELNLGPESAMLIDDNPIEREQMRQQNAGIRVLELPEDPALYTKTLLDSPWLECLQLTDEDFKRTSMYKARQNIESLKKDFSDLTSFYASLNLRLYLNPIDESNLQRALQLINKTNQFNTTTYRFDQKQLEALTNDGGEVIVIGVEDKFSSFENIGVLIVRWNHPRPRAASVVSYLLSCRVLGKGIEVATLDWLKTYARKRQFDLLVGEVIETERNLPVRSVFSDAGFQHNSVTGKFQADLNNLEGLIPPWLTIVDNVKKGDHSC